MLIFWIVAAMFSVGALLVLLPGLLRPRVGGVDASEAALAVHRDQWREAAADVETGRLGADQLAAARFEIDQRAREEGAAGTRTPSAQPAQPARRTAAALALLLPIASVCVYLALGDPQAATSPAAVIAQHSTSPDQVQKMVAALAERLKAQPDDADGWTMLGRSYVALGRHRDAATALQRANALSPGNASLLADLADVLAMAQGRKLAGEPARMIQRALDADAKHVKALALAGTAAFEAKDYAAARGYWQRLLAEVPAESPLARSVGNSIAEATAQEGGSVAANDAKPAAARGGLGGDVVISAELAARVGAGDTLFIFARAAEGPRMPLAIVKRPAKLPAAFTLDDSMAMSPQTTLSGASAVVVGARISKSGNATPQPGDLVGQIAAVKPGAQGLRIVIDRVQP
jgi:cytochrome c-type biogenesis protein CcmH